MGGYGENLALALCQVQAMMMPTVAIPLLVDIVESPLSNGMPQLVAAVVIALHWFISVIVVAPGNQLLICGG